MAVRGRVLKEENEDRDLWMNKHPCPNSYLGGSTLPFPGGLLTRMPEKGVLVWGSGVARVPFSCANHWATSGHPELC